MATLNLDPKNLFTNEKNVSFLLLGAIARNQPLRDFILRKLLRKETRQVNELWGTLGYANKNIPEWKGEIAFSDIGNLESSGTTLKEIKNLYAMNPELGKDTKVLERFINFDKVDFTDFPETFNEEDIPQLRLELFLQPDEGALVYYEHYPKLFEDPTQQGASEIEYIMPEAPGVNLNVRDRLTYLIPVLPKRKIIVNPNSGKAFALDKKELNKSFIVKILTFKRNNLDGNPSSVINSLLQNADGKYRLERFDVNSNSFQEVDHQKVKIDPTLKTLFLIHGTFKTTEKTYEKLLEQVNGKSWLQQMLQSGKYAQIIGFTHYTILHDAEMNIQQLKTRMGNVTFRNNPVDVVTISRGGLVGKYLMCVEPADFMPVRKAVLIACANGVGYFDTAKNISRFLSVLRSKALASGNAAGAIASVIAQFSVDTFRNMPGAQQLTIGNDRLNRILAKGLQPHNANTKILPVIGDWDPALVKDKKLLTEWGARGLDRIVKNVLGDQHDWVVGAEKQAIMPAGTDPAVWVKSVHTKYLDETHCKEDVKKIIENYFA
jgi:hypothetical protein